MEGETTLCHKCASPADYLCTKCTQRYCVHHIDHQVHGDSTDSTKAHVEVIEKKSEEENVDDIKKVASQLFNIEKVIPVKGTKLYRYSCERQVLLRNFIMYLILLVTL